MADSVNPEVFHTVLLPSPAAQLVPEKVRKTVDHPESEKPYRVFIHNDDVTPMDFVIHILVTVFELARINAEHVMYSAHLNGKAYVQTLPLAEARRRVGKACFAARLRKYPLQFSIEAE